MATVTEFVGEESSVLLSFSGSATEVVRLARAAVDAKDQGCRSEAHTHTFSLSRWTADRPSGGWEARGGQEHEIHNKSWWSAFW